MRFWRFLMFFSVLSVIVAAIFLFRVRYEVTWLERSMKKLSLVIDQTKEEIAVLSSELDVYTSPARLGKLIHAHAPEWQRLDRGQLVPYPARPR